VAAALPAGGSRAGARRTRRPAVVDAAAPVPAAYLDHGRATTSPTSPRPGSSSQPRPRPPPPPPKPRAAKAAAAKVTAQQAAAAKAAAAKTAAAKAAKKKTTTKTTSQNQSQIDKAERSGTYSNAYDGANTTIPQPAPGCGFLGVNCILHDGKNVVGGLANGALSILTGAASGVMSEITTAINGYPTGSTASGKLVFGNHATYTAPRVPVGDPSSVAYKVGSAAAGLLAPADGEAAEIITAEDGSATARSVVGSDAGATGSGDSLYRGDTRSPAEIKAAGGFKPKAPGSDTSLYDYAANETPSNFVSTSTREAVAEGFVLLRGGGGYVYTIDPAGLPTVDVNAELGAKSPYPDEREIAVPGGIPYRNVIQYREVR
jgi:Heat-labile enterotoxin alpha chain